MGAFATVSEKVAFSTEKMTKQNVFDSTHMFCDVYGLEPGQEQKAHAHAGSDKVYYVLEGTADVQIGDETRRLEVGGLAHAAPGVAHAVKNPGPARVRLLVFMSPKP
ncbi:MAG: cupin domain-containing protein [Deltaproteobacteria bacterium]|nr:cupin domain-containing protein [Deltaproteobacteria bacterium]